MNPVVFCLPSISQNTGFISASVLSRLFAPGRTILAHKAGNYLPFVAPLPLVHWDSSVSEIKESRQREREREREIFTPSIVEILPKLAVHYRLQIWWEIRARILNFLFECVRIFGARHQWSTARLAPRHCYPCKVSFCH